MLPRAPLADQPPRVRCILDGLLDARGWVIIVAFKYVVRVMGAVVDQVVTKVLLVWFCPFLRVVALRSLGRYPLSWHLIISPFLVCTRALETLRNLWHCPDRCKTFNRRSTTFWGERHAFIVFIVHLFYLFFQMSPLISYLALAERFLHLSNHQILSTWGWTICSSNIRSSNLMKLFVFQ